jgi:hypothetical protein
MPQRSRNAWQQYARITVNIVNNPPRNGVSYSFSDAEVAVITNVLNRWKDSPTCADISFTQFIVGAHDTGNFDFSGNHVTFAKDDLPLNDGRPVLGRVELASNGTFLIYASTYIDPSVTNITAFEHTIAHEFGHTFGLRHALAQSFVVPSWTILPVTTTQTMALPDQPFAMLRPQKPPVNTFAVGS